MKNGRTKSIQILKLLGTTCIDRKYYGHAIRCFVLYQYMIQHFLKRYKYQRYEEKNHEKNMSTEVRQVYGVTLNFVYTRSHVSVSDEKVHIQSRASLFCLFVFISLFRKKKIL